MPLTAYSGVEGEAVGFGYPFQSRVRPIQTSYGAKGWTDSKGEAHERVYDLAVSGDRVIGPDGRCKKVVGNTVNVEEAGFSNSIGAPMLSAYWQDPEFDPKQHAFYYVRVLEIPTPNWTVYDAKKLGAAIPEDEPTSIQDRAYTSPIWYTPR